MDAPPTPARPRSRRRTAQSVAAWEAMFRAYNTVMRELEDGGSFGTLTPREYDVLLHLSRGPETGMRQRELLQQTMLPQPSVSRTLSKLEEQGLLLFEAVEEDRRGRRVVLTDLGREVQRSSGRRHVVALREAFSGIDLEDIAALERIARALEAKAPAPQ